MKTQRESLRHEATHGHAVRLREEVEEEKERPAQKPRLEIELALAELVALEDGKEENVEEMEEENLYKCGLCEYVCFDRDLMDVHWVEECPQLPPRSDGLSYKCRPCGRTYSVLEGLQFHWRVAHCRDGNESIVPILPSLTRKEKSTGPYRSCAALLDISNPFKKLRILLVCWFDQVLIIRFG